MNYFLKRFVLVTALALLCSAAFAQRLGETSTRSNIINDLPVFEQLMVNGIRHFRYDNQGRISVISTNRIDRLETGMNYELDEQFSYDNSGKIVSYRSIRPMGFGPTVNDRTFEYNGNGDIIHQKLVSSDLNDIPVDYNYDYDSKGNLTSITSKGNPMGDISVHFAYKYDDKGNATYAAGDNGMKMNTGDYYFGKKESIHIKAWKPEVSFQYPWEMKYRHTKSPGLGVYKIYTLGHNEKGNSIETELLENNTNMGPFYLDSEFDKSGKVIYQINFQSSLRYSYNQKDAPETIKPHGVKRYFVTDEKSGESVEWAEETEGNRYNYYFDYKYEYDSNGRIIKEIEYLVTAR